MRFFLVELTATILGVQTKFFASDCGYVGGGAVYPAMIVGAIAIDRAASIDPSKPQASASWGEIKLDASDGRFSAAVASGATDGALITILTGKKSWDTKRGLWIDPPYANLQNVFVGTTKIWSLSETAIVIYPRDATYWLEDDLPAQLYTGQGGYSGTSGMTGLCVPMARGGICHNVTPVLVDPVQMVFQYHWKAGQVSQVYEGGAAVFTVAAPVTAAAMFSSSPAPGSYRVATDDGLIQLGSAPQRAITADVQGNMDISGTPTVVTNTAAMVLALIRGMAIDERFIAAESFVGTSTSAFYTSTGTTNLLSILSALASGDGASLVVGRDGRLTYRKLRSAQTPTVAWTEGHIVSVSPVEFPDTLSPPPFKWRVSCGRNWTVQTTDLSPLVSAARKQYLARSDVYSYWQSNTVKTKFQKPNNPAPVVTFLETGTDAVTVAVGLGAMWSGRVRLYDIVVPSEVALAVDIGSAVTITYPIDDLRNGVTALIVSESWRSDQPTATVRVFVNTAFGAGSSALDTGFRLDYSTLA